MSPRAPWASLHLDLTISLCNALHMAFLSTAFQASLKHGPSTIHFCILSLAQSRCSLNWKGIKIDSSCKDNRQWGFNTKSSELRRWLPRSECGRARHHLTRKGLSQTGTKQRQEQCRWDNHRQSKTKAPTQNSSLCPASDAWKLSSKPQWRVSVDANTVMPSKLYRKTFWSSDSRVVLSLSS